MQFESSDRSLDLLCHLEAVSRGQGTVCVLDKPAVLSNINLVFYSVDFVCPADPERMVRSIGHLFLH